MRLTIALAIAAAALTAPASAEAVTTCSYDTGTKVLTVAGDPDVGTQLRVDSVVTPDEIHVSHLSASGVGSVNCAGAVDPTTTNTDRIEVTHTSPDESTLVRVSEIDTFAPGTVDEGGGVFDCPDEVEIEIDLGAGDDEVQVTDSLVPGDDGAINLQIGDDGVDRNPSTLCSDLEIEAVSTPAPGGLPDYSVFPGGGNDVVNAQGGTAAGDPLTTPLEVDGGSGRDVVRGGKAADTLVAGPSSKDKLFGMEGSDGLFAEDDRRDAKIDCGPGPKLSEFAVRDGKDPEPISC